MIVIKDMEMPKKCGECGIYVCYRTWHGDPGDEFCGLTKKNVTYKTKPEWCPLSEAPERKRGKWEYHSSPYFGINAEDAYCSHCGYYVDTTMVDFDDYDFCPHCGAELEEE